uniref:D-isomer specific 2-hydroxyacid dehydrogenase NAD-binding domain-containing protein n=1 Tax=Glossina morsitans morsitans TaxID=37546 RepID=A0A1B0G9W7_GLOMM
MIFAYANCTYDYSDTVVEVVSIWQFNAKKVPFTELVEKSDIIFIAASLTPQTHRAFKSTAFQKMKPTAVLVNIARGPIVNQENLYTFTNNG